MLNGKRLTSQGESKTNKKKPEGTNTVDGEIENCGDKDRPGGAAQHRQGLVVIVVIIAMITVLILIVILMRLTKMYSMTNDLNSKKIKSSPMEKSVDCCVVLKVVLGT